MNIQERTIVNEAEVEAKTNQKKILGLFPRSAKSRSASGSVTPEPIQQGDIRRPGPGDRTGSYDDGDADEDLPARESSSTLAPQSAAMESKESVGSVEEDPAVKAIPKTAGFDFAAISKELGKEIDVERIKIPTGRVEIGEEEKERFRWGAERTGSAPPPAALAVSGSEGEERDTEVMFQPSPIRSASYDFSPARQVEEEEEDAPTAAVRNLSLRTSEETAAWDRPASPTIPKSTPDIVISPSSLTSYPSYPTSNAWSSQPSPTSIPRPAPPARPHPPEFMANPFANGLGDEKKINGSGGGGWGWGRKQKSLEEEVSKNPW